MTSRFIFRKDGTIDVAFTSQGRKVDSGKTYIIARITGRKYKRIEPPHWPKSSWGNKLGYCQSIAAIHAMEQNLIGPT